MLLNSFPEINSYSGIVTFILSTPKNINIVHTGMVALLRTKLRRTLLLAKNRIYLSRIYILQVRALRSLGEAVEVGRVELPSEPLRKRNLYECSLDCSKLFRPMYVAVRIRRSERPGPMYNTGFLPHGPSEDRCPPSHKATEGTPLLQTVCAEAFRQRRKQVAFGKS